MSAPEKKSAGGPLASILALPNDNPKKTIFMSVAVCLVCSIFVASAAVGLRPLQIANQEEDRIRNIVGVAGVVQPGQSPMEAFQQNMEAQMINLEDGTETDAYDATSYDIEQAAKDPAIYRTLRGAEDVAGIRRQPRYMPVYIVRDESGGLERLVLPIYGAGLWSTMYGFLSLDGDLQTVSGLKFYQHAETPGLGGEIDNPQWLAMWEGKVVLDDDGRPILQFIKGNIDHSDPNNANRIDGLAGATLTARGVESTVNFWLGDSGYGPFIARLRNERG